MPSSRWKLAAVIAAIALLTLLVGIAVASVAIYLVGDWEQYAWGLTLALKIMWWSWFGVATATTLTFVTAFGWKFRRPRPTLWPAALKRAMAEGKAIAADTKTGATSFTFTVILVSLLGGAVLAIVPLAILGLWFPVKVIGAAFWPMAIATVLVRVAIFGVQRKQKIDSEGKAGKEQDHP